MPLDYNDIKTRLESSIRTYIYPQQLDYSKTISLYDCNGIIEQEFYPFRTSISTCLIYCHAIIGNPFECIVDILSQGNTISSNTISFDIGWNTINLNRGDIVSKNPHTLRITGQVDINNDIKLGMSSSSNSYFYGTITGNNQLAFSIGVEDFVYTVYPIYPAMKLSAFPLVITDIISKPAVRDRYLTGHALIETIQAQVEIYSRYPDEIDKIAYGVERGLMRDRKTFGPNVRRIIPVGLSDIGFISPEIFFRTLKYNIEMFVSNI